MEDIDEVPKHPCDPIERVVKLPDGISATYTLEGETESGPLVVAVHGMPGGVRDFRYLASAMKEAGAPRLLRIGMPGFDSPLLGDTPYHGCSLRDRASFVNSTLCALDLQNEETVYMGHSMGGPIATLAANMAADEGRPVVGLALLASVGLRRHPILKMSCFHIVSPMLRIPVLSRILLPIVHRAFVFFGFPRTTTYQAAERAVHCALNTPMLPSDGLDAHSLQIEKVRVPVFVTYSKDDHLLPNSLCEEFASKCPPGPRLVFNTGGHVIQKQRARSIAKTLGKWLPTLRHVK